MASTPCKGLKKDGTPCRGNGLEQLDGYCIAHAPADEAWQWRSHGGKASPASRLPSCPQNFLAQSLVNARTSLARALVRPPPLQPPQKGFQRGPCPPAATTPAPFASQPSAVMCPKLFCPISRKLSCNARPCLVRARVPVPPLQPPQKGFQRGLCPPRRDHAGALRQPTVCRHAPKIFCPIARKLSWNSRISLVHALLPVTPFNHRKKASSAVRMPPPRAAFASRRICRVAPKISCPISRASLGNSRPSLV